MSKSPKVYVSGLRRVLELAGGVAEVSTRLNLAEDQIYAWILGSQTIPETVFLRIVDLLADLELASSHK